MKKAYLHTVALLLFYLILSSCEENIVQDEVPLSVMQEIFEEVKTPHKYGIVFKHPDSTKMVEYE